MICLVSKAWTAPGAFNNTIPWTKLAWLAKTIFEHLRACLAWGAVQILSHRQEDTRQLTGQLPLLIQEPETKKNDWVWNQSLYPVNYKDKKTVLLH